VIACWLLLAASGLPTIVRGQETPADSPPPAAASKAKSTAAESPGEVIPLGQYVPKDKLGMYFEFSGLDAHADAWSKTAAAKMLTDTPLGGMLEEVASQLLDRFTLIFPNRRVSGPELVKLIKHAIHSGFVVGLRPGSVDQKASGAILVIRNAGSKEMRSISARVLGWMMGADAKPKIEHKEGRTLISVPLGGGAIPGAIGWAWWTERSDLVVCAPFPSAVDDTLAALDGKVPSAVDHPIAQELHKPDGAFTPVGVGFFDPAVVPSTAASVATIPGVDAAGLSTKRLELRFGFDDDALMTVLRMVHSGSAAETAAVNSYPTFDKTTLLPMPEGVDSFVELSMSPAKIVEMITQAAPGFKEQYDDLSAAIRATGKVDVEKDLLGGFGPKMAIYLAPGRSAVTTSDESPENLFSKGMNSLMSFSALQAMFPKITLIAEVKDPVNFAKALDTAITAINSEFKARAIEIATEAEAAKGAPADAGRNAAGKSAAAAAERAKRRRIRETPHPMFKAAPDRKTTYFLHTPHDSVMRFGTSSLGPTVQLDGKYLAISVAPDAVRGAIDAIKSKNSKPSAKVEKALDHAPDKMIALLVEDISESLPTFLASLPGTLQALINTSIAMSALPPASGGPAGGPAAAPTGPPPGGPLGGAGPRGMGLRMAGGPRPPGSPEGPGQGGRGPGAPAAPAAPSMLQFNIDPAKLPKAEDLKALMFANTISVAISDREVKLVARGAFPTVNLPILMAPISLLTPPIKMLAENAAKAAAAAAPTAAANPTGPPTAPQMGRGGGRFGAAGPSGPMGPGGRGGRRGPGG
jgi:hypothetical protein